MLLTIDFRDNLGEALYAEPAEVCYRRANHGSSLWASISPAQRPVHAEAGCRFKSEDVLDLQASFGLWLCTACYMVQVLVREMGEGVDSLLAQVQLTPVLDATHTSLIVLLAVDLIYKLEWVLTVTNVVEYCLRMLSSLCWCSHMQAAE